MKDTFNIKHKYCFPTAQTEMLQKQNPAIKGFNPITSRASDSGLDLISQHIQRAIQL